MDSWYSPTKSPLLSRDWLALELESNPATALIVENSFFIKVGASNLDKVTIELKPSYTS
jgi:hypothetical protein